MTTFKPVRQILFQWMIFLLFAWLASPAQAQQFINPRFSRFTVNEGLSQSLIYAITQDHKGFMWFGTKDGLNRFDGYEFRIYHHDPFDSTSLPDNTVTALYSDSKGRLWVGTISGGLSLYDRNRDCFYHIQAPNLSNANIHAITEDSHGNLWVGTYGNGLFQLIFDYNKGKIPYKVLQFVHQPEDPQSLQGNFIIDVFADRKGKLWVSNTAGRFQYAMLSKREIRFHTPDFTIESVSKKIIPGGIAFDPENRKAESSNLKNNGGWFIEDQQHQLWVGLPDGLYLLDQANNKLLRFDPLMPGLQQGIVRSASRVIQDIGGKKNSLWLGFFGGLGIFNTSTFTLQLIKNDPGNSESLLPGAALCIYQDRSGCIWLGSSGYGLSKYNARAALFHLPEFHTADGKVRTENLSIRSFFDAANSILIGSSDGLWKADEKTRIMNHVLLDKLPGSSNSIYNIISATSHSVWMATNSGLVIYDVQTDRSKVFLPHIQRDNQSDNRIFKLYNDGQGHIWCLSAYTFSSFNIAQKTFTHYYYNQNAINGFSEPSYGDISPGMMGNYWLGTGNGLLYFDTKKKSFRQYVSNPTDTSSLSFNTVRCVLPDPKKPDKYLWVGTAGGGLNKFNLQTQKFSHYTIEDGLPNNVVYGILSDLQGRLWMSTNKGISRFDPDTEKFQNFTIQSGLQSNEFNSGAFYKNNQGKIFFGGIEGYNSFYPEKIKESPYVPPVVFTGLRLSNHLISIKEKNSPLEKPISETQVVTLSYKENNISLQVAGLDYSQQGGIRYAYKMENMDKEWIRIGANRMITFSNLDPGHYTLQVRTVTDSGIVNKKGATLRLIITPPWWETWWAYTLYGLLLLAILYYLRGYELKRIHLRNNLRMKHIEAQKLKELDHMKSRFFANISHEFRTPLTLLIGPLEDVIQGGDPKKLTSLVPEMHRNSKRLMQLINQLLDLSRLDTGNYSINTTREDIIPFVRQIVNSFSSLAERKNITLETEVDSALRKILNEEQNRFYFDADIVEKVLTNLLSNAFKFTPDGGEIFVGLGLYQNGHNYLELKVEDNGIGIPGEKIAHIFDRFYQVDHFTQRPNEGSGIGLALVKELVELHHGRITVSSVLNKGAIFTCVFPLDKKTSTVSPIVNDKMAAITTSSAVPEIDSIEKVPAGLPNGKQHILVVEDHRDVRKYIVEKLVNAYRVSEARNGKEGLETAVTSIPDLIISDVMMPEMDGFELCKSLKTDDRTSHIPVILLTARAEDADKITGLETGADAYLIKPFNSRELQVRIQKLIELRNRLRSKFSGKLIVKPSEITVTSRDREFMQTVLSVVEQHLDDEAFSVEVLGQEVHMSRSQISRKLKAIIDQSPQQFIQSIRMQRALDLLKKDAATISEIAFRVGYEDPGYFSRAFKKHFGFLPSEREKFAE